MLEKPYDWQDDPTLRTWFFGEDARRLMRHWWQGFDHAMEARKEAKETDDAS